MSKLSDLAELYRDGLATARDFDGVKPEDVVAIKTEKAPRRRFVAEKAHDTDTESAVVVGVPISTEDVDRVGDVIKQAGWQTENFKRNPVVLFAHNHCGLPIALATKSRRGQSVTGKRALLVDERYHSDDLLDPMCQLVKRHVLAGALPGRSVGFLPIDVQFPGSDEEAEKLGVSPGGLLIKTAELLEESVVPIPCNQHALQERALKAFKEVQKRAAEDFPSELLREFEEMFPLTEEDFLKQVRERRRATIVMPAMSAVTNAADLDGNEFDFSDKQQHMMVQTLIFDKETFETAADAKKWAKDHDFRSDKVDETENSWRLRQRNPNDFKEDSFRTISMGKGIKAVVGKLKEEEDAQQPEAVKDNDTPVDGVLVVVEQPAEGVLPDAEPSEETLAIKELTEEIRALKDVLSNVAVASAAGRSADADDKPSDTPDTDISGYFASVDELLDRRLSTTHKP